MSQNGHAGRLQWIHNALDRYEGQLTRYAQRIVGDSERARDVVQDTFLRLCREKPERLNSHLGEWLYTVCRNRALDICRKEGRMTRLGEAPVAAQIDHESDPSASMEAKETRSLVLAMIAGLPEKQEEAIRLKFQHGLSYRQISKVMDLTTSYVGYLIHAGLKTIRDRLSEESGGEDAGPVARIPGPGRQPTKALSEDRSGDPPQSPRGKIAGRGG